MATKKASKKHELISVVVPAYRASKFIESHLIHVKNILDETHYKYEIICVCDGMTDKTFDNAKKAEKRFPRNIRVMGYLTNHGKGHAVRYGMANAKGDIIGFADAGKDFNPQGIVMLLEHMNWYGAEIIIGSKRHPVSKVEYPWQRRVLSFGYQKLVKLFFGLDITDSQVGMKFFRREVLEEVLPRVLVKEFAFDIEVLSVAKYLGFSKIYEAPVEITMDFSGRSTVLNKGLFRMIFLMLWDTVAVFYRLRILKYYDTKNKKNWITPEYLGLHKK